jgi:hypothetical protein
MGRKLIQVDARSEGLMWRLGGVCIIDAVSKEEESGAGSFVLGSSIK